jgi:hypothetical protein
MYVLKFVYFEISLGFSSQKLALQPVTWRHLGSTSHVSPNARLLVRVPYIRLDWGAGSGMESGWDRGGRTRRGLHNRTPNPNAPQLTERARGLGANSPSRVRP